MTESEQLVFNLSQRSFLSIWSFPNPLNIEGKELCDVLVVCEPNIIIFSVKEIQFKNSGRPEIDMARWRRSAIDESSKQAYGAERAIASLDHVIECDGSKGIPLPSSDGRQIHRVAVALGSKNRVPLTFGDFGKGFVHVFDEKSLAAIMTELDTITDFVDYLKVKENYYYKGHMTAFSGEEDLLALYVVNGNSFPVGPDMMIFDEGLWSGLAKSSEMQEQQEAREISYLWDALIERFHDNFVNDNYRTPWTSDIRELAQLELAVRAMTREPRHLRIAMSERIQELLETTPRTSTRARVFCTAESPTRYVFMTAAYNADRETNFNELQARCLVARGLEHSKTTVVGLLLERTTQHDGDALTLVYIDVEDWTDEYQERMDLYQYELGLFKNSQRVAAA